MAERRPSPERPCLFCAIVAGQEPAQLVHEDATTAAFLDTRPLFPGHLLLVPREHVPTLAELPAALHGDLLATAQRLMRAQREALRCEGTFVAVNNVVSQSVPHLHVHVVPRTRGDGLRGFFWPRTRYRDGEADEVAQRLRAALADPSAG